MTKSTFIKFIIIMEADLQVPVPPTNNKEEKPHKKGEPREKRPRPERKNEYEYNAQIIDENTVIPPLPKKSEIIAKPDIAVYKAKQAKNSEKIEAIIAKKKAIRDEKFKFNRRANGEGDNKFTEFQSEISEVQQLREKLGELKVERNDLREKLHKLIQEAKANNEIIKRYRSSYKGSREMFNQKLEQLEHRLLTASLSKNEEKCLNDEITVLKRKMREADLLGNTEYKLEEAQSRKEQLNVQIDLIKKAKDPIESEFSKIKEELDKRNGVIAGIKGQLDADKSEKNEEKQRHDKEYEKWKEEKKARLDKLELEIGKLKEDNKKIWDQFHQRQDDHWKQKQLIDFIEWQNRVKQRKVIDKEKAAKHAEYEKKDKEREREEQLKKYLGEIELINFLINYLNSLRSESTKVEEKKEEKIKPAELTAKLASDSQWKKQKGLQILQSKKSKLDEQETDKKGKKQKKKNQQETKPEDKFLIPFNVQNMFETLKLLPPSTPEEIDGKLKQLREREELFLRVSKEDFNEEDKKLAEEIKGKQAKKKNVKATSKEEDDFPTI